MFSLLPQELILKIFSNLSLKDCRSFTEAAKLDKVNQRSIPRVIKSSLEDRESSTLYLTQFFPDVSELLARMRMYNVWIVASLALNYFSDHAQDKISEIIFIIPSNVGMLTNFMEYMRIKGVEWSPCPENDMSVNGFFDHRGCKFTIKLNTVEYGIHGMIEFVKGIDLSILQCAITGYSVFHMYADDVYDRQCSIWEFANESVYTRMSQEDVTKKYLDLGYKFINGSRYIPNKYNLNQMTVSRTIGGVGSEITSFRVQRLLSYSGIKYHNRVLREYQWYEHSSHLRGKFSGHDDMNTRLYIFRKKMRSCFESRNNSSDQGIIDAFVHAYGNFEKSVSLRSVPPLDKNYEYDCLDQKYYAQFPVVSVLEKS
jgi:hypothetical protein